MMPNSRWNRRTWINRIRLSPAQMAVMLIVLGLIWRTVRFVMGNPIWGDESFVAVNYLGRDFHQLTEPYFFGQIVPLLFMVSEWSIGKLLGYGEHSLRLIPYLFGMISLLMFWSFAKRIMPRRAAVLAVGIFAASYYIVRHSVEAKPYGMDLFFSLSTTYLAWLVIQKPSSIIRWIGLGFLMATIPWCSYPGVFIGCAVLLALWLQLLKWKDCPGRIAGAFLVMVVFGISVACMAYAFAIPHAEAAKELKTLEMWRKAFFPLDDPGFIPLWLAGVHTGEMFAYPHGGGPPTCVGTFLLFVIGAYRMWKQDRPCFWLLATPFVVAMGASAFRFYPYGGAARIAQYLAPAICLLAGLGLYTLFQRFLSRPVRRWGMDIAVVAFAGLAIAGIVQAVLQPYKTKSVLKSYQVMKQIKTGSTSNDRWVVFNSDKPCNYAPYLGDWWGVGGQFVFDAMRFAPHPLTPKDFAPAADSLSIPDGGSLYVLVYHATMNQDDRDPPKIIDFPNEQLDTYIESLEKRLGKSAMHSFTIKSESDDILQEDGTTESVLRKLEVIRVYRFSPDALRTN